MSRNNKGQFVKGNKEGRGRPRNPEIEELRKAIEKVQKDHDSTLLEHFVERAYTDNTLLVALMRKLVPDKKALEGDVAGTVNVQILDYANIKLEDE